MRKINKKDIVGKTIIYTFLIFIALFSLIPIIWMLFASFKKTEVFSTDLLSFFPRDFSIKPYLELKNTATVSLLRMILNSFFTSIGSTILNTVVCILAAYSIAARRVKGGIFFLVFFMIMMIIPQETITIPLYLVLSKLQMLDTYEAIIFSIAAEGLSILILYRFFKELPTALLEAAQIDGANELALLFRIVLPLSLPAITTVLLIQFVGSWNTFIFPLIIATDAQLYTLNVGMSFFNNDINVNFEALMALGSIITIPTLLIFIITQRTFIKGVTSGAIKE